MDDWAREKERSRSVFKETLGYDRPSRFTGWKNAKIAAYTPVTEPKIQKNRDKSPPETEYDDARSMGAIRCSSRFRLMHGQVCHFCKKNITSLSIKEHISRFHPNSKRCKLCPFITENGRQALNIHINIKHKHIHECASCRYANVCKLYKNHVQNNINHHLVQYQEIKTFNEMVDTYNLPIRKLAQPSFEMPKKPIEREKKEEPKEMTIE